MADEQKGSRRGKLRELRQKRQEQPGYVGTRTGLKGLWSNLQAGAAQGGNLDPDDGPKAPFVQQLLKNPKVRQTLEGWLGHGGIPGSGSVGGMADAPNREKDFAIERLHKGEELTSSSSPEEIAHYRQQLENRADWLEAAMEETLMELERVSHFQTEAPEEKVKAKPSTAAKKKLTKKTAVKKRVLAKKKRVAKKKVAKAVTGMAVAKPTVRKKVVRKKKIAAKRTSKS